MFVPDVRLRIETSGESAREYRIADGRVEVRSIPAHMPSDTVRRAWHRLTPEQLSIHVERNTVVARWLEHRLGWQRLLQACTGQTLPDFHRGADKRLDDQGSVQ